MIIKLTEQLINNDLQQYANDKRTELVSDERTGLYVEVRPSGNGVGTYYLRYKDNKGKSCHERLGRTNEITLTEARQKVASLKSEIEDGKDINAQKTTKKGDMLLNDFWDIYYEFAKSTKRSHIRDYQLWNIHIKKVLGSFKLSEIQLKVIQSIMTDMRKTGLSPASADQAGQLCRRLGSLAVRWNYLDVNFARGLQLFNVFNEVSNIPDDVQMQKLIHVLKTDKNRSICLLVLFLLNTGCRLGEALSAKLNHFSIEKKLWTIPAKSSKSKRPRQVVLTESALSLLKQIDRKETDIYVFTNRKTNKPYVNIFKPWDRLRKKAGLPNLRLHDLRHSFASILVNNGASIYQVSQLLGHADTRVTQRYAHLSTETLLTTANSVSDKLSALTQPKPIAINSDKAA